MSQHLVTRWTDAGRRCAGRRPAGEVHDMTSVDEVLDEIRSKSTTTTEQGDRFRAPRTRQNHSVSPVSPSSGPYRT